MLRNFLKISLISGIALSSFATLVNAQTSTKLESHKFKVEVVVQGLRNPWGMTFLPNGDILVTEKNTQNLRLIRQGQLLDVSIPGVPKNIDSTGQGGLLDITSHPNFKTNNLIYISYSGMDKKGIGTEVARAKFIDDRLENFEVIFKVKPKTQGSAHYGSRLQFAKDGTLFITTGDRYSFLKESQNPTNHIGSILRLNDDGSIPKDNPFVGHEKFLPEIYSYGHRNVQGLTINPKDQTIWAHEHGPQGGDEVNKLNKPGANYGWPLTTFGVNYGGGIISDLTQAPGIEAPILHWTPSIAPSGMTFYSGERFPNWSENLFVGALSGRHIRRIVLENDKVIKQEVLLKGYGRIRDVKTGPDGYIYALTDSTNGKLLRLEPQ